MVKRKASYETKINENMRGGEGTVKVEQLLTPDELNNKGRLFAKLTVEPGSSIGKHVHEGEIESYFIISGVAEYDDDGEVITLYPGDTTHTPNGKGHSIRCSGEEPLEFIALILFV
jgi:mannose-6-phosphate isomerase-like protein (cupin superfamily)